MTTTAASVLSPGITRVILDKFGNRDLSYVIDPDEGFLVRARPRPLDPKKRPWVDPINESVGSGGVAEHVARKIAEWIVEKGHHHFEAKPATDDPGEVLRFVSA